MSLDAILDWIDQYGVFAVFLGTLWDASGLQMFTVAGGIAASTREAVSLWTMIAAGTAANVFSDMVLYGVGRWRARWLDEVVRSDKGRVRLQLIGRGMRRYAWPILIFGRFLPWFGRFVPAAAGLRYVNAWVGLAAVTIGAVLGSAFYASLGYFLGRSVQSYEGYALWIVGGALLLSIPAARWLLKRFDQRVEALLEVEQDGEGAASGASESEKHHAADA